MKKLFVLPIMLLYMLAQSGMLVHLHYCGGKLESWNLFQQATDACGDDNCDDTAERVVAAENDGCCQDKVVSVKIVSEQSFQEKAVENIFGAPALLPLPLFAGFFGEKNVRISRTECLAHAANAPPGRWQNLPLYKLHMRFTFYG